MKINHISSDLKEKSKYELIEIIKKLEFENQEIKNAKKYGLVWERENAKEEFEEKSKNSYPVLQKVPEKEIVINSKKPNHLLIEGDNYHVLTIMQYTHFESIDVIYIDPPYNTGNGNFKYNDKWVELEDTYRHSKWLNFMEKRLKLAYNLLKDDGVIFISIDDNEVAQLKLLCDQIFGEKCFVGIMPWKKRTIKTDVPYNVSQDYEYIVVYAKPLFRAGRPIERKYYETDDFPGKPWRISDLTKQATADERPNSYFTIVDPKNGTEYPANKNSVWRITRETFPDYLQRNKIVFPGDYNFSKIKTPKMRIFKWEDEKKHGKDPTTATTTFLPQEKVGMYQDGTREMINLFGTKIFSYPKPIALIKHLIDMSNKKNAVVLDFFAGSGTTAHATMELNKSNGGNRQCILITNNEVDKETEKRLKEKGIVKGSEEFEKHGVCYAVTFPRLKKAIHGYITPDGKKVKGLGENLRYYKTKFVAKNYSDDDTMINITNSCSDILCIKENIFTAQIIHDCYRIYEDNNKVLAIQLSYLGEGLAPIRNYLASKDDNVKKVVYCFSFGNEVQVEDIDFFSGIPNVVVKPIPKQIVDIYREVSKKWSI